jgi:hypothetical protein
MVGIPEGVHLQQMQKFISSFEKGSMFFANPK